MSVITPTMESNFNSNIKWPGWMMSPQHPWQEIMFLFNNNFSSISDKICKDELFIAFIWTSSNLPMFQQLQLTTQILTPNSVSSDNSALKCQWLHLLWNQILIQIYPPPPPPPHRIQKSIVHNHPTYLKDSIWYKKHNSNCFDLNIFQLGVIHNSCVFK